MVARALDDLSPNDLGISRAARSGPQWNQFVSLSEESNECTYIRHGENRSSFGKISPLEPSHDLMLVHEDSIVIGDTRSSKCISVVLR